MAVSLEYLLVQSDQPPPLQDKTPVPRCNRRLLINVETRATIGAERPTDMTRDSYTRSKDKSYTPNLNDMMNTYSSTHPPGRESTATYVYMDMNMCSCVHLGKVNTRDSVARRHTAREYDGLSAKELTLGNGAVCNKHAACNTQ